MPIIANIVAVWRNRLRGGLPSCVKNSGTVVSWFKDLLARRKIVIVDETAYYAVDDAIGVRSDDIYYGQYLDATSGQINFYRSTGTFDYTDPSDGSLVEDVAIPGDGLYTIPVNGICDIVTSDGSRYPCCERAGTVLHDVLENSVHISVSSPSWAETLYGSDHLNQYGYATKTNYDDASETFQSLVNGSNVALDDSTLVPAALWGYEALLDVDGDPIYDSEGDLLKVKGNL